MIEVAKPKTNEPNFWEVVLELHDQRSIPDLELTKRAVSHWQRERNAAIFGYVSFSTLREKDILSILAAAQKGTARVSRNDSGQIASYKILAA